MELLVWSIYPILKLIFREPSRLQMKKMKQVSKIEKCLDLQNPLAYTGHSFRKSSATLLGNKGVEGLGLKRHGGWPSSSLAEGTWKTLCRIKLNFQIKFY